MKVLNTPIDVVCTFTKEGCIKIDRFRITEDHRENVIRIKSHETVELEKIAGEIIHKYKCQAIVNNQLKTCELRFKKDTTEWILFKI